MFLRPAWSDNYIQIIEKFYHDHYLKLQFPTKPGLKNSSHYEKVDIPYTLQSLGFFNFGLNIYGNNNSIPWALRLN